MLSSVNAAWVCVVGTALPFIFVLPNTSLNDLFHLWNGYLVETARFNSLRGKTQKNIKSTFLLCCKRNPFSAPQGLYKTTYAAGFMPAKWKSSDQFLNKPHNLIYCTCPQMAEDKPKFKT